MLLRWPITFASNSGSVKWTSNSGVSKTCAGPAAASAGAEDMDTCVAWLLRAFAAETHTFPFKR